MKKSLCFSALLICSSLTLRAQTQLSFEASENYTIGNIHNQNGWEVTESGSSGIINNQVVTSEKASHGSYSFKNGYQSDFDYLFFPFFGATKAFETPISYANFSISFDVFINLRGESDFEFTLYGILNNEFVPVAGLGLDNRGYMYIFNDVEYGIEYAEEADGWPINTWHNIRIEVDPNDMKFYLNHNLVKTIPNYTQTEIHGFNMLHNNFGGDAYYDNFVISSPDLAVNDLELNQINIFPNPVKNVLHLTTHTSEDIKDLEVVDLTGKTIMKLKSSKQIHTESLGKGTYILKINLKNGKSITRKFIKQ